MILVVAKAQAKAGEAQALMQAAKICIEATLQEEGNISYTMLQEVFDENKFTFLEKWESLQALDAHSKSAHFQAFGASVQSLLAAELMIEVYNADPVKS